MKLKQTFFPSICKAKEKKGMRSFATKIFGTFISVNIQNHNLAKGHINSVQV